MWVMPREAANKLREAIDEQSRFLSLSGGGEEAAALDAARELVEETSVPQSEHVAAHIDPAAIMDIVTVLNDASRNTLAETNLSDAYRGFDQFMRQAMRCATEFETWATAHVEFEENDGVWAYEVGGHFMRGAKVVLGAEHADDVLMNLAKLDAAAWPKIAEAAGLPIVAGRPAGEQAGMVGILAESAGSPAAPAEDAIVTFPSRLIAQGFATRWTRATLEGTDMSKTQPDGTVRLTLRNMTPEKRQMLERMVAEISSPACAAELSGANEVNDQPLPAAPSPSSKSGPKP